MATQRRKRTVTAAKPKTVRANTPKTRLQALLTAQDQSELVAAAERQLRSESQMPRVTTSGSLAKAREALQVALPNLDMRVRDGLMSFRSPYVSPYMDLAKLLSKLTILDFYPRSNVPSGDPAARPYEETAYREELSGTYASLPQLSVATGYAGADPNTGVATAAGSTIDGWTAMSAGPRIAFEVGYAVDVDFWSTVTLDYELKFSAEVNPSFVPNPKPHSAGAVLRIWLAAAILEIKDTNSGLAWWGVTNVGLDLPASIAMVPFGGYTRSHDLMSETGENHIGTELQIIKNGLQVPFHSTFRVPGNSRCEVVFGTVFQPASRGPIRGTWNSHIGYAEAKLTAHYPSIRLCLWE